MKPTLRLVDEVDDPGEAESRLHRSLRRFGQQSFGFGEGAIETLV